MILTLPLNGKVINSEQLKQELIAAGQQITGSPGVYQSGDNVVITGDNLNSVTCQQVLDAHVPIIPRVSRPIASVHSDLLALTGTQQTAIENYLKATVTINGVTQARWKFGNANVWAQMPSILGFPTGNAHAQALAIAAANYAIQFPTAFVNNPAVDNPPTINIPGDQPGTP